MQPPDIEQHAGQRQQQGNAEKRRMRVYEQWQGNEVSGRGDNRSGSGSFCTALPLLHRPQSDGHTHPCTLLPTPTVW